MTFKFCAVLVALCAPEPRSTDSLGTQHCANFESHSNRVTFESNAISITSSIHALLQNWLVLEIMKTYLACDQEYIFQMICQFLCQFGQLHFFIEDIGRKAKSNTIFFVNLSL